MKPYNANNTPQTKNNKTPETSLGGSVFQITMHTGKIGEGLQAQDLSCRWGFFLGAGSEHCNGKFGTALGQLCGKFKAISGQFEASWGNLGQSGANWGNPLFFL